MREASLKVSSVDMENTPTVAGGCGWKEGLTRKGYRDEAPGDDGNFLYPYYGGGCTHL